MKDLRYLVFKDRFLLYSYLALKEHFNSYQELVSYFNSIQNDEQKNLFLKTASFYLSLVKQGDWHVDIPESDSIVEYLTNTYKYIAIFSLIESLNAGSYIDFYSFLVRRKAKIKFPIHDKNELKCQYGRYKEEFGSIQRCLSFFKSLSPERQKSLVDKLEVKNTEPTIENLAKYLYDLRCKFVHEAELVLEMSEAAFVGRTKNKMVICRLSIQDIMRFFEEGLIVHFQSRET